VLLLCELIAAIFALALQHPARIFARQCADRIKLGQLLFAQGISTAARLSASCSGRLAPIITLLTAG
jgi:hypothetical protein